MEFLSVNTISAKAGDVEVTLPHPANFALHKLLVMTRRNIQSKKEKDKAAAVKILGALIDNGLEDSVKEAFRGMPKRWQSKVKKQLADITDEKILDVIS